MILIIMTVASWLTCGVLAIVNADTQKRLDALEAPRQSPPIDTLAVLTHEWHRAKFALMESVIYEIARNNPRVRKICYAMQAQDSIYMDLMGKKK